MRNESKVKSIKLSIKIHNRNGLINLVCTTLICSGPPLWLILRIHDRDMENLMGTVAISFLTLIYMTFTWCHFFLTRKETKQLHEDLLKEVTAK
ncbi:hypothetical protein LPC27_13505 [Paraclostridium bifermentans]|uniref:hypothetical protein n=1 Tax=Paraclostridium bifermentans TaxID=1490 RepID=UPI001F15F2FE|nr:hypothetical protein [Paraclostridium bifermentans]MCE9676786.1 hypothetical protein [Paraclostridium bifermentans]